MSDILQDFLKHWARPAQDLSLGSLDVSSTRLSICDPVAICDAEPEDQSSCVDMEVPIGTASLSVRQWKAEGTLQNAFAMITFADGLVAEWEHVEKVGGANPFSGFESDYGYLGFMDEALRTAYLAKGAPYEDEAYDEWLWKYLDGENDMPVDIAKIILPQDRVFCAVLAPGGNGSYEAFAGRDDTGALICITVDLISPTLAYL